MVGNGGLSEEVSMQPADRISRMNTIEKTIECRRAIEKLPCQLAVVLLCLVTRKIIWLQVQGAVLMLREK